VGLEEVNIKEYCPKGVVSISKKLMDAFYDYGKGASVDLKK